jgi:hypothetical protein
MFGWRPALRPVAAVVTQDHSEHVPMSLAADVCMMCTQRSHPSRIEHVCIDPCVWLTLGVTPQPWQAFAYSSGPIFLSHDLMRSDCA